MAVLAIVPSLILMSDSISGSSPARPRCSASTDHGRILIVVSAVPFFFHWRKVNADIIQAAEERRNAEISERVAN